MQGILTDNDLGMNDRLLGFALRLVRREVASAFTLNAIRQLNPRKLEKLVRLANAFLTDFEKKNFDAKISELRNIQITKNIVNVNLPCGKSRVVQDAFVKAVQHQY